jgi:hypothetical protein
MVKKMVMVMVMVVAAGALAAPSHAMSGCTTALADCYVLAAKVDSFWYRWAAGLDCELDYTECVRIKLVGV